MIWFNGEFYNGISTIRCLSLTNKELDNSLFSTLYKNLVVFFRPIMCTTQYMSGVVSQSSARNSRHIRVHKSSGAAGHPFFYTSLLSRPGERESPIYGHQEGES